MAIHGLESSGDKSLASATSSISASIFGSTFDSTFDSILVFGASKGPYTRLYAALLDDFRLVLHLLDLLLTWHQSCQVRGVAPHLHLPLPPENEPPSTRTAHTSWLSRYRPCIASHKICPLSKLCSASVAVSWQPPKPFDSKSHWRLVRLSSWPSPSSTS